MRLFRGWAVVAGAFLVLFVAYGAHYSFGVFFSALLDEFHWSRGSLSGAFALYASGYCIVGFPAGRLTDRWGPRAVITTGGVFLGVALMGMSLVSRLWQPYLLYGVVAALGMGTAYVPCNATVVKWFVRRRGLAVGLASSGASVGTFVFPPLAQLLITVIGWRRAYLAYGAGVLVALTLLALLMHRDPESVGLHPDGDAAGDDMPAGGGPAALAAPTWPLSRAARTGAFWLLAAAFSATWLPVFIPLVHLVRFSRDLGFAPMVGATVMSALGVGAVVGRLVMGPLSDRIGRRAAVCVSMAVQAAAFACFPLVRTLPALYLTTLLFGFSYGAISTLFTAIIGDFFGRAQAGALVGVLFALAGSLGGLGPYAAGAIYDATGSYAPAFLLGAGLNALGAVLLLLCRPPREARTEAMVLS